MRPEESPIEVDQRDLFWAQFSSILDHRLPLYVLVECINCERFDREFDFPRRSWEGPDWRRG